MSKINLNDVPMKVQNGTMSKREAVNFISSFIIKNLPIFGLHRYDEDFREELILSFLERGERVFEMYNPELADFFTYLYCFVFSLVNTMKRKLARQNNKDAIFLSEGIVDYQHKEFNYQIINYSDFEAPKVPYSYKTIKLEDLQKAFAPLSSKSIDKKNLVLAMRSSFDITDNQIQDICKEYNIDEKIMYDTILYCKESIISRTEKLTKAKERRNMSYFNYRNYDKLMYELLNNEPQNLNQIKIAELEKKLMISYNKYCKYNNNFEDGYLHQRPTNKTIALILNICERQVSYYLACAKKDELKKYKI